MQANGMITRFRSALESSTIATEHRLRLLADFKVAVVEQVIQRKGCKEKNSMEDVASEFASRMAALVSACNIMPSDGDEEKETEPHVDGQVDGIEKTNMAAKGFKIGDVVNRRFVQDPGHQ